MASSTQQDDVLKRLASETTAADLWLLRSKMYSDGGIVCGDNNIRSVHRCILASRSTWFKRAFDCVGNCSTIEVDETSWGVDLLLYYFYAGYIDMADKNLTGGRHEMVLGAKLWQLGETFEEKRLEELGSDLLKKSLGKFDFSGPLTPFFDAVREVFYAEQPGKLAKRALQVGAYAARDQLFRNEEFRSFVQGEEVPEFGSWLLSEVMASEYQPVPEVWSDMSESGQSVDSSEDDFQFAPFKSSGHSIVCVRLNEDLRDWELPRLID